MDTNLDEMGDVFGTKDRAVLPFCFENLLIALKHFRVPLRVWRFNLQHVRNCLPPLEHIWETSSEVLIGVVKWDLHTCIMHLLISERCPAQMFFRLSLRALSCGALPSELPPEKRHVCLIPLNNSLGVGTAAPLWRNIPSTRAMWQYLHVEQRDATIAALPDITACHTRKRPDLSVFMRDDKQAFYSFTEKPLLCKNLISAQSLMGEPELGKSICFTGLLWSSCNEERSRMSSGCFTWGIEESARDSDVFVSPAVKISIQQETPASVRGVRIF